MKAKPKTTVILLAVLALAGIAFAVFLPSSSRLGNLDFYVFDTNNNYHYETNEVLEFFVNDTAAIKNRELIWHFGNGDTLMRTADVRYKYRQPGTYLVTLNVDARHSVSKYIKVISAPEQRALDSIPRIHGVTEGYQGEELVFSAQGPGIDTWYWEFGETGTVDAYEQQVIYIYDTPGEYTVTLQTNTTKFPVYHQILILPRFEKIDEIVAVDSLSLAQDDIKRRLQAIANAKVSDRNTFYANVNYIRNTYFCDAPDQVAVVVNGDKYNDFYSYCQGLHFLQSSQKQTTHIDDVKIDNLHCIKVINVTQSNLEKQ